MGQACCKADETKVMQPNVIRSKTSSFLFKLTGFSIADLTTPRSLPLLDKHGFEEPLTSILSPKERPGQSIVLKISCLIRKTC